MHQCRIYVHSLCLTYVHIHIDCTYLLHQNNIQPSMLHICNIYFIFSWVFLSIITIKITPLFKLRGLCKWSYLHANHTQHCIGPTDVDQCSNNCMATPTLTHHTTRTHTRALTRTCTCTSISHHQQ